MQSPAESRRVVQKAEASRPVGKRSAAGRGASVSKVPDGNHGDNLRSDRSVSFHMDCAAEELHDALAVAQSQGWSDEFMKRLSAVINELADLRGLAE